MEDEGAESPSIEMEESPSEEPISIDAEPAKADEPPASAVSNRRRRGKRKVARKHTYKDEEGFLGQQEPRVQNLPFLANHSSL